MKKKILISFSFYFLLAQLGIGCDSGGKAYKNEMKGMGKCVFQTLSLVNNDSSLSGKKIAVLGFTDGKTGEEGCRELSVELALMVEESLHIYKQDSGVDFDVALRHSIEAVETEGGIGGSGYPNIDHLLSKSDFLVTGIWLKDDGRIVVHVKVIRIGHHNTVELCSHECAFGYDQLSKDSLLCLNTLKGRGRACISHQYNPVIDDQKPTNEELIRRAIEIAKADGMADIVMQIESDISLKKAFNFGRFSKDELILEMKRKLKILGYSNHKIDGDLVSINVFAEFER